MRQIHRHLKRENRCRNKEMAPCFVKMTFSEINIFLLGLTGNFYEKCKMYKYEAISLFLHRFSRLRCLWIRLIRQALFYFKKMQMSYKEKLRKK